MPEFSTNNDNELIQKLHRGDEDVVGIIYKKYWKMMYLAAYNILRDKEICEDIVQDIFVKLWDKRQVIHINTSLKSYLYTSTIYKVYDFFKKDKKIIKVELFNNFNEKIQSLTPETKLLHDELIDHFSLIIEQLPEKCKLVFKLSREENMSNQEIAEKLNISKRTVEGHISKALLHIRKSVSVPLSLEFILFLINSKS